MKGDKYGLCLGEKVSGVDEDFCGPSIVSLTLFLSADIRWLFDLFQAPTAVEYTLTLPRVRAVDNSTLQLTLLNRILDYSNKC